MFRWHKRGVAVDSSRVHLPESRRVSVSSKLEMFRSLSVKEALP